MKIKPRLLWLEISPDRYLCFQVFWSKIETLDLTGEWEKAECLYRELLEKINQLPQLQAKVRLALADLLVRQGAYHQALELLELNQRYYLDSDDGYGLCRNLGLIGDVHSRRGEFNLAFRYFKEMEALAANIGSRDLIARSYNLLGNYHSDVGNFKKAEPYYRQWLDIARENDDLKDVAHATGSLGNVYFRSQQYDRALECYQTALDISRRMGDRSSMLAALGNSGQVYKIMGQYDRARECFLMVRDISQRMGYRYSVSLALGALGDLESELRNFAEAESYYKERFFRVYSG